MKPAKPAILFLMVVAACAGLYFGTRQDKIYPLTLEGKVLAFAARNLTGDCIVVSKSSHLLYYCKYGFIERRVTWNGFDLEFPCPIAIGSGGRNETPVGEYYIVQKNPSSRYTLFLGISYPSVADANNSIELGYKLSPSDYRRILVANMLRSQPPWDTPLGGAYGIHGAPTYMKWAVDTMERKDPNLIYVTKRDNTQGCVAIEHRYLYYLYANVDEGTPILILN